MHHEGASFVDPGRRLTDRKGEDVSAHADPEETCHHLEVPIAGGHVQRSHAVKAPGDAPMGRHGKVLAKPFHCLHRAPASREKEGGYTAESLAGVNP